MQKEREFEKQHHQSAIVKGPMNMIHGAPDVTSAAHVGQPNLNPPDDAVAASEVLKPNAGVTGFTLSGSTAAPGADAAVAGNPDAPVKQEDAVSTGTVESGAALGSDVRRSTDPAASGVYDGDSRSGARTRADASANSGTSSPAGAASTGTSTDCGGATCCESDRYGGGDDDIENHDNGRFSRFHCQRSGWSASFGRAVGVRFGAASTAASTTADGKRIRVRRIPRVTRRTRALRLHKPRPTIRKIRPARRKRASERSFPGKPPCLPPPNN